MKVKAEKAAFSESGAACRCCWQKAYSSSTVQFQNGVGGGLRGRRGGVLGVPGHGAEGRRVLPGGDEVEGLLLAFHLHDAFDEGVVHLRMGQDGWRDGAIGAVSLWGKGERTSKGTSAVVKIGIRPVL